MLLPSDYATLRQEQENRKIEIASGLPAWYSDHWGDTRCDYEIVPGVKFFDEELSDLDYDDVCIESAAFREDCEVRGILTKDSGNEDARTQAKHYRICRKVREHRQIYLARRDIRRADFHDKWQQRCERKAERRDIHPEWYHRLCFLLNSRSCRSQRGIPEGSEPTEEDFDSDISSLNEFEQEHGDYEAWQAYCSCDQEDPNIDWFRDCGALVAWEEEQEEDSESYHGDYADAFREYREMRVRRKKKLIKEKQEVERRVVEFRKRIPVAMDEERECEMRPYQNTKL